MKTLILNGSPRPRGDTMSLINVVSTLIDGEVRTVRAYDRGISPCMDCRYCWEHDWCCINDDMNDVYRYIQDADNIIIASPVYFSEITGKMLDLASRLQMFYCARHYRDNELIPKAKRGAVMLVGGGDGTVARAFDTAKTLLHQMNCHDIHPLVFSHNTNYANAGEDPAALEGLTSIARFFNNEVVPPRPNKKVN